MKDMIFLCWIFFMNSVAHALVCHECGVPGTTSCEDAVKIGIVFGEECPGFSTSCVATSFVFSSGERIHMKSCNLEGSYMCSEAQNKKMSYTTCEICTTDFCNGPLPSCFVQSQFGIKNCITSQNVMNNIVIASVVVLVVLLCALTIKKYKDDKKVEREQRSSLIAKYYSRNTLFKRADDMTYTQI